jgi:hypothetical protein
VRVLAVRTSEVEINQAAQHDKLRQLQPFKHCWRRSPRQAGNVKETFTKYSGSQVGPKRLTHAGAVMSCVGRRWTRGLLYRAGIQNAH